MDTSTKTHISSTLDTASVAYPEMRQAIHKYTGLVGATRQQKPTPMDISGLGQAERDKQEEAIKTGRKKADRTGHRKKEEEGLQKGGRFAENVKRPRKGQRQRPLLGLWQSRPPAVGMSRQERRKGRKGGPKRQKKGVRRAVYQLWQRCT